MVHVQTHSLSSTEISLNNEGNLPLGVVRLVFSIIYRTSQTDVEVKI
jgi:hypothetical protein